MKPGAFEYRRATSIQEALSTLAVDGEDVRVLAGGQSLIPMMNMRMARPSLLVDIGAVAELDDLRVVDGMLRVGAMTRQATLEHSETAVAACPLAVAATTWIGHRQIRSRGTVGGTIAHADPAAELPTAAVALGAEMVIRSSDGERVCAAANFFEGFFGTAVQPSELLTEVRFPTWGRHAAFSEISRRHGDFAIIGVGAALDLGSDGRVRQAGIALAGVGPAPIKASAAEQLLVGRNPTDDAIREAALAAVDVATPTSDIHGSAAFRTHLVRVLTIDALARALASSPSQEVPA
ncbi:xanthine dehydrogenase family protein subunit M [Nocardioides sp.]|uniref:FAD binding domain-containing protein n=1 Tax=Nocardioides sp. TaxID=35761 RepID=UPI0031FEC6D3|nr:molybdopterin dehydrogenase FAD-binding protein [Nocardioides sp.]